jgi:hypothetical protein
MLLLKIDNIRYKVKDEANIYELFAEENSVSCFLNLLFWLQKMVLINYFITISLFYCITISLYYYISLY